MADDLSEQETSSRKTKAQRLAEVHERAMRRFDAIWSVEREERLQSIADRRFATIRGAQWEGQYAFGEGAADENGDPIETGLPRMEIPKVHKSLIRLFSDYRAQRISVDFRPKGDDSDRSSADALDGLYRADENDSRGGGQDAYDNGFDEAISGGRGAWRLRAEYEDDSDEANESQRIRIEPIYDADQSVFFDLDAKHQDKSDALFAFIIHSMSPEAFEAKYPDADMSDFVGKMDANYDWATPETVKVAEYFEVEDRSVFRRTFRNIATGEEETFDDADLTEGEEGQTKEDELLNTGWEEVRARRIKRQKVRKYVLSGNECLEDHGFIAGPNIPIVPVYGKRWYIDGIERAMGHVRLAIDATRIYNMMVSSMVEAAAASPFERPIFDPEQVQGLEMSWARANIDRAPYSLARVLYGPEGQPIQMGPIGKVSPPQIAPNVSGLAQLAGNDIAELTGENEQAETVPSNTSAQAIELTHNRADERNFIYLDNQRKAMQRSGEIWLGMAKELYVEQGREMIAIDPDGGQKRIKLAEPMSGENDGRWLANDLTKGNYEVIVDVGPASRSKRDATVKAMAGLAQVYTTAGNTAMANACLGVATVNMDGEGLDQLQQFVRQQGVREGWIKPNEEEAQQLAAEAQNQQPDPQAMLVQAATMQAQAEAELAQSRTAETQAKAEQARARTAEILAGIEETKRKGILDAIRLAMDGEAQHFDQIDRVYQNERSDTGNV